MKAVAMIPARSGSKGLKNKNILDLAGVPVIAHSIIPALECGLIDSVYLNSDSEEYLKIGEQFGAISYKRDLELASSNSSMRSVVEDFCNYIRENSADNIDCVVILYPTYPFRCESDIRDFILKFREIGGKRSVVGLKNPDTHPCLIYKQAHKGMIEPFDSDQCAGLYRRQEYPKVYELTHWICVVPISGIMELNNQLINDNTYGYLIGQCKKIVDIDDEDDYIYAKYLLEHE